MAKFKKKVLQGIHTRIVKSMSGFKDVEVKLDDTAVPSYSPSQKVLIVPSVISWADNDEESFDFGRGVTIHETGHVLFAPSVRKAMGSIRWDHLDPVTGQGWDDEKEEQAKLWLNVFLDANNDHKVSELYPHLRPYLRDATKKLTEGDNFRKTDNPIMQVYGRIDPLFDEPIMQYPDDPKWPYKEFVEQTVKEFKEQKIIESGSRELVSFTAKTFTKWLDFLEKKKENPDVSGEADKLCKKLSDAITSGNKGEVEKLKKDLNLLGDSVNPYNFKDKVNKNLLRDTSENDNEFDYSTMSLEKLKDRLKKDAETMTGKSWGNSTLKDHVSNIELTPEQIWEVKDEED